MNSRLRLLFGILLLCLASLALVLAGCSSSSKSNQPLDVTAGTWTFVGQGSNGGGASFTAAFTTFLCSNSSIPVGKDFTETGPLSNSTVCVTSSPVAVNFDGTPEGLVLGMSANPVPANGTATIESGEAWFAMENESGTPLLWDVTGTFTASTKSFSGQVACDPSCSACDKSPIPITGTIQ
jgi:hypothetical protein